MKKIKALIFDIIETLCAMHILALCLLFIAQGCNKKTVVTETKQAEYFSKNVIDTVNHDTIIYSNKITREYHYKDNYITSKITVHPDTVKTFIEKIVKEAPPEPEPWYFNFWKIITVLALFLISIISITKLFK